MASSNRRVRPPSALSNSVLPNDSDDDESELSDVESPTSSPIGRSRFTQIAEDDDDEGEDEDAEGEEDDEDAEGEEVDEDEDAEGEEEEDEEEEEEEEEEEDADHDADDNSPDDDDEEDYELEDEASESAASTPVPTITSRSRNVRATMAKPVPQPKSKLPPAPRSRRPPAPTSISESKSKSTVKAQVLPSSTAHRLTLKMPKDKLRGATSGWASAQSTEVSSSEVSTPKNTVRRGQARAAVRNRRKVVEPSSDEEEEEEEEEDEDVDMSDADADGIADDTMVTQQAEDDESSEENPFGSDDEDMEVLPIGIQSIVSGASTPDLAKLTKRQRGRIDELYSADLMELPNSGFGPSPANKLHLTADEQALKRTEMARRRRNLTVQKVEEEKMETVNRLLYRQPTKPKSKPKGDDTPAGGDNGDVEMEGGIVEKAVEDSFKKDLPPNGFVRWTNRKEGSALFVPNTCLQIPLGRLYGGSGYRIQVMDEEEAPVPVAEA